MLSTLLKLLLSLAVCSIGFQQKNMGKEIASLFCFTVAFLLMVGFFMDVYRFLRAKLKEEDTPAPKAPAAPAAGDYPDNPDPSDLKIGKTFRAADVMKYLPNIQKFQQINPDYLLSESEIIDNFLTDKKIWKYTYQLTHVTLEAQPGLPAPVIGVFAEGCQIGRIHTMDCPRLLKAMKASGVEVVYCTVGGGPYKVVGEDPRTGKYTMITAEKPYGVTMSILEK